MDNKSKKLIMAKVLSEYKCLYKNNFSLLFKLNAIGVIILIFTSNIIRLRGIAEVTDLYLFFETMLTFVGLYFNCKVQVALILAIKDIYDGKKVTIKESYNRAKEYMWKYIGALLWLGIIVTIPLSLMFGLSRVDSIIFRIVSEIIGAISLSYIMVNYGLAICVRIFKPEIKKYFTYSKKLVSNHFWEVFYVLLVAFLIQSPNSIMTFFIDVSTLGVIKEIIYNNISHVIALVVGPFMTAIMVIVYLKLDIN